MGKTFFLPLRLTHTLNWVKELGGSVDSRCRLICDKWGSELLLKKHLLFAAGPAVNMNGASYLYFCAVLIDSLKRQQIQKRQQTEVIKIFSEPGSLASSKFLTSMGDSVLEAVSTQNLEVSECFSQECLNDVSRNAQTLDLRAPREAGIL